MRKLTILLVLTAGFLAAAEPPLLKDSGLPAGQAESVLPQGAALHVRFGNLAKSLDSLDALLQQFVPEEALPPPLKAIFAKPKPVLTFIGMQTLGAPLDAALIGRFSGLDATRPLSLTLYPGSDLDWVVSLPVSDFRAATGLLVNLTRARSFAKLRVGKLDGWQVEGSNPDLPRHFTILCSKSTVYCVSSPELAARLGIAGAPALAADPAIAALPAAADLVVGVSTLPAKPLVAGMAQQFSHLPPPMLDGMRRDILRSIGHDGLNSLNLQIRLRTSFSGVEEILDYGECMLTAASETFVPALSQALLATDGASIAIELRPEGVRVSATLLAKGIETLAAKPLPLADLRQAVAALPGEHLWFSATGRRAAATPGSLGADWADLATRKLAGKGFISTFLPAIATYWRAAERTPVLEDSAAWVLTTSPDLPAVAPAGPSFEQWCAAIGATPMLPDLQVVPHQDGDVVARYFQELAAVENRNAARWTKVLTSSIGDSRWIDTSARFRAEPRAGKATRLVYEDAWVTRSGIFGYSQHELINRVIAYTAKRGSLDFLQRVDGDRPCWLDDAPVAAKPLPAATAALLALVPEGADSLTVARVLPALGTVLDAAGGLEKAVRHDLDAYLAACATAISAHPGDEKATIAAISRIPMPMIVASLNFDAATAKPYLVLPGNLRYPRPEIAPVLRGLFTGFLAKSDSAGGLVAWTRSEPGRTSVVVHQDLRALALLVRTTGNAVWKTFLADGDPEAKVQALLGTPADGRRNDRSQIVLSNSIWPR